MSEFHYHGSLGHINNNLIHPTHFPPLRKWEEAVATNMCHPDISKHMYDIMHGVHKKKIDGNGGIVAPTPVNLSEPNFAKGVRFELRCPTPIFVFLGSSVWEI